MKERKILIVDDDANMRESVADNLDVAGYAVFQAASGQEAIDAVGRDFFGVILMDYNLTDMTGIDAIRGIRGLNSESQILMLTAQASLDTAMKAIRESVVDFFPKPVEFDKLKHSIDRAFERLDLIQENARLIADLKKANEELSHLNHMKSKFMSMSSHDLANALMSLQTNFDLLSESLKPDAEQGKRIGAISTSIDQVAHLASDLVDWAAIEQGKFRLAAESVDLAKLCAQVTAAPQARAKARGIDLSIDIEPGLPEITADKGRIAQVLTNLLENAIRHTTRGGRIAVRAASRVDGAVVSVSDTGEGIASEELSRIFESFYQGSGNGGRLGLGLAISKEIVEAHHGQIAVESDGPGRGATFRFTLPK
ncbi:MAG: sensor histidine kinase [Elusimicrobiota bacterium]